uniref:Uncharacterized protein n=1 Tax=Anopheles atroparvus TaxID=41427 RepID=A0AAG5DJ78_ANOAO
MADEQANPTSETYWRRVVFKWVKCSALIPSEQFNNSIENIRLHSAFDAFKSKTVATYPIEENTIIEFVRVHFPDFELELDEIYGIPKYDNVYIFSLMLYFSCVRWSIPYFQNVCKGFDEQHQYSVKTFLNSFVVDCDQKIRIDRNFLDAAITKATSSARHVGGKPSKLKQMNSSDAQIFSSTPVHKLEMKKPSPHSPKTEWKMNSLKHLLDSVRSENFSLETQNEKLAQRIKQLNDDKQRYLIKIKAMQLTEQLSDDSSLKQQSESNDRMNDHFRKQLEEKDALIEMLQDEISKAKETACMEMERISVVKTNNLCLKRDIQYLENSIETLNQELSKQNDINVLQIEIINDLRRFIRENRLTYSETLAEPLECSFECFEKFVENYSADNSRCLEPENLASTVVEVKLKDQEKENERLLGEIEKQMFEIKLLKEDHHREKVEINAMVTELQKSLTDSTESKKYLEGAIEQQKATIKRQDEELANVNARFVQLMDNIQALKVEEQNQLATALEKQEAKVKQQKEDHKRKEAEMNAKTTELQRSLDEVESTRKQLQEALEKEVMKTSELSLQLENLAKQHVEDCKREDAEANQKVAELRKSLAEMVESKSQLAEALEKQEAKVAQQDEVLKCKEAEMNAKTAELQRSLDEVESTRKQLQEALEKEVMKTSELSLQLENLAKQHVEDCKREHADANEKVAELQKSLAEMVESKSQLAEALEKQEAKVAQQDEVRKCKEAEMNAKTAELQRSLDEVESTRKQLQEALEKEVMKTSELSLQLENLAKQHVEDRKREHAEANEKVAELRKSLAEMVESKSQLAEALEKQEAKVAQQDEVRKCKEAEMNAKTAELQRSLDEVESTRKQLQEALEKEAMKTSELSLQLENLAKQHVEDRKREHADANEKVAELQKSLAEMVESKSQLAEALEKQEAKVAQQDEARKCKEAEMNAKTAELQRSLDEVESTRKQLQEALEKEVMKTSELSLQLENLAKQHVEDRKREHAEANEKVAELRKSLAEMVESKSQLAEALEKQEAKVAQQDEARKCKEAEMNAKTAELQRSLDEVESTRKQLQEALEKEVMKTSELSLQLENLAKQHVEDRKREHADVNEKVAELQKSLAEMVESKSQLAEALEKQEAKVVQQDEARKCKEAEMNAKTAELQRSLDEVESTRKQLQEALEKEVMKTSELGLQLENLAKQHVEACNMKDEMIEKSDELSSQCEMVKTRSADLESQCIKLLKKVSTQNEEISALKTDLEQMSSENQIQQTERMQGTVTVSELQKAVEEKESQLQALAKENDEKRQMYEKCHSDNEILCAKLYMARSELTTKGEAWAKDRSSLQEVIEKTKKAYEAKVREARIEFEDKMERMKERMPSVRSGVQVTILRWLCPLAFLGIAILIFSNKFKLEVKYKTPPFY